MNHAFVGFMFFCNQKMYRFKKKLIILEYYESIDFKILLLHKIN